MMRTLAVVQIPTEIWDESFIRRVNVWDMNTMILVGSLVLVTATIFVWAAALRKPGRRPRYHFARKTPKPEPREQPERWKFSSLLSSKQQHHHHHRRRRHKLPRNPTLAEAGGLPPIRSEEQPPTPT